MKHKHHIIPKHMGGDNSKENLIELSIEERNLVGNVMMKLKMKLPEFISHAHSLVKNLKTWQKVSEQLGAQQKVHLNERG